MEATDRGQEEIGKKKVSWQLLPGCPSNNKNTTAREKPSGRPAHEGSEEHEISGGIWAERTRREKNSANLKFALQKVLAGPLNSP